MVETSLGYFINPLRQRAARRGPAVASGSIARNGPQSRSPAVGVTYLTWSAGHPPWIALTLAFSFGLYGLVRKVVQVDALAGFASETLLLLPLGIGYLVWCEIAGTRRRSAIAASALNLLLAVGGPLTAIPLVLFAFGARRIPYSTVGLLQYIGPTIQLMLAVFVVHEPFSGPRVLGFVADLDRARDLRRGRALAHAGSCA